MAQLSQIEWYEGTDSNLQVKKLNLIVKQLNSQIQSKFISDNFFYFIAPEPARHVHLLMEKIEALNLTNGIKFVKYGHQNRGWGITFQDSSLLELLIPLFFHHGSECLAITAIKASVIEEHDKLSLIINSIMFGENNHITETEYTGLYFECGRLIELL